MDSQPQASRKRQTTFRLPPELIAFADEQARRDFCTRNDVVQRLLAEAYQRSLATSREA